MSVRARTTLAATIAVAVALVVTGIAILVVQRRALIANLDEVADLRAGGVAALGAGGELRLAADDDEYVRVTRRDGATTAETPGFRDEWAALPAGADALVRTVGGWRVTALDAGDRIVHVATSLEPVDESIATLRAALLLGGPVLLLLVALTTWFVIGRALRPVEAIRLEVESITERSLDRRVPQPSTDDEIARLAATMNVMLDRLETGTERQRRFVADASHELRTPLAALRTDLETAPPDARRDDLLATVLRMERLVGDLLYLARHDAPRPVPPTPIDLDDLVREEVAATPGPIRIEALAPAAVTGRRDDLARVVRNLLDNAVRHASTTATVRLEADSDAAVLSVRDDGPGVPPAERERIFERFTRLDGDRARSGGGTGLGLAIAREIVRAHGGTIAVEDGARFVVRLPTTG